MTDPFDAAAQAGHQLQADLTATQQALAAETAKEQADQATIAALRAQVDQLEAQLNDQPKPRPAPAGTVWGVNASGPGELAAAQAFEPKAVRVYLPPGAPLAWPSWLDALPDEVTVVLSDKVPIADKAAGKADAALRATLQAVRGRRLIYCPWHEPENDPFTPAEFVAAFEHLAPIVHEFPDAQTAVIYMDWTFNPKSGRNWRDWWPGNEAADILGVDAYRWSPTKPPRPDADLFDPYVAAAQSVGKPWGLFEVGVDKATFPDPAARLQALSEVARAAAKAGPVVATYFNRHMTHDWTLNPAEIAAWRAGQG